MKYCTNCHTHKQSWAEVVGSQHSNYKCWSCDKWTLSDCHGHCNHYLYSENSRLQNELSSERSRASGYSSELTSTRSELSNVRGDLTTTRNTLKEKESRIEDLRKDLTKLEIEGNDKDNEIKGKNKELEDKDRYIGGLENELDKLHEETIERELEEEKRKVNFYIDQLKKVGKKEVKRAEVRKLWNIFQQLNQVREKFNPEEIDKLENEAEEIKDEWSERDISIDDVDNIEHMCKKIASLKTEQRKRQEQRWDRKQQQQQRLLQAQVEVPPHQ